jgi:hypothetical protein
MKGTVIQKKEIREINSVKIFVIEIKRECPAASTNNLRPKRKSWAESQEKIMDKNHKPSLNLPKITT